MIINDELEGIKKSDWLLKGLYRQVSFYASVTFLINIATIEHKIPIKRLYFLGGQGIDTLILYIV